MAQLRVHALALLWRRAPPGCLVLNILSMQRCRLLCSPGYHDLMQIDRRDRGLLDCQSTVLQSLRHQVFVLHRFELVHADFILDPRDLVDMQS